jgi:hypothetical protein
MRLGSLFAAAEGFLGLAGAGTGVAAADADVAAAVVLTGLGLRITREGSFFLEKSSTNLSRNPMMSSPEIVLLFLSSAS